MENPITIPKNIPYDENLTTYLQYPENQRSNSWYIQVYTRLTSTLSPGTVKHKVLSYLKENNIYMQKNDVPSSNLVYRDGFFSNTQITSMVII